VAAADAEELPVREELGAPPRGLDALLLRAVHDGHGLAGRGGVPFRVDDGVADDRRDLEVTGLASHRFGGEDEQMSGGQVAGAVAVDEPDVREAGGPGELGGETVVT